MIEPKRYALLTFGKEAKMVVASESLAEVTTTYVPWADYLALRAECEGLRAISDAATPGPWVVSERRVPWSLPERTYQVANFPVMTDPAKTGEHVERTIITGWDHPQAKGPIGIVCNSFCIGNEGGPGVHLVYMSAEDAAFIVACVNHIRAAIDAGREG